MHDIKNGDKHTRCTIVSWPKPEQYVRVNTLFDHDVDNKIKYIYVLLIIKSAAQHMIQYFV